MWNASLIAAVVLLAASPAAAHPDWALEIAASADACEDSARAARDEAAACRAENSDGDDDTCPWINAANGAQYSPDEVDAIAARWDGDTVTLRSYAEAEVFHQQAIDAADERIAALGFSHHVTDFDDWKRQSEELRTTAMLQTLEGVWGLVMAHADTIDRTLTRLTPKKLKKLARSLRDWVHGARPKHADELVDVLGKAKDLILADAQGGGWAAACENLLIVLGWAVAAMPAAAAAEAALIVAGAKALFTDLELAAFLYGAGHDLDGLTRLTEGDLRTLRDLHDGLTWDVEQAVWLRDDAATYCRL
jgi:hypothetical protein